VAEIGSLSRAGEGVRVPSAVLCSPLVGISKSTTFGALFLRMVLAEGTDFKEQR
jgi:hypothetical protein